MNNKPKISLSQLEKFLFQAADVLRGSMEASEYKEFIFGMELIDQSRGWGLPSRVVVGDAGYGEATDFRDALESCKCQVLFHRAPGPGVARGRALLVLPESAVNIGGHSGVEGPVAASEDI